MSSRHVQSGGHIRGQEKHEAREEQGKERGQARAHTAVLSSRSVWSYELTATTKSTAVTSVGRLQSEHKRKGRRGLAAASLHFPLPKPSIARVDHAYL